MHDGGSPAAERLGGQGEGLYTRMTRQDGVDCPPQVPDAFAMNDPHPENAALAASFEVIRDQFFDFLRTKGVQVQDAIDGQLDGS